MTGQVDQLAIGAVADATGVSVTTLRYYDELGIISPAMRVGGKRRFNPDIIGRVSFVRRAHATLDIGRPMGRSGGPGHCHLWSKTRGTTFRIPW